MFVLTFGAGLALDIITSILHVVSIGLTLLRLYYRRSTCRLGWDDLTAAIAVVLDAAFFSLMWPFFGTTSRTSHLQLSIHNKVWITVEFFFAIVCLSRMSIALAIARVLHAKEPVRKIVIGLAIFFGVIFLTLQVTAICSNSPITITTPGHYKCQWTDTYKMSYIFVNIVSDLVLVAIPLYKLWRVRLPTRQRRLILAGFAASLLPTLGVVAGATFQLAPYSWEPGRSATRVKMTFMQTAICLGACNFLVIITYFDNMRRRRVMDREQATRSLHRTESLDTSQERGSTPPPPHSNQVPPSDVLTTLVLTEITGAYITVDATDSESSRGPQSYLTSSSFVSGTSEEVTSES